MRSPQVISFLLPRPIDDPTTHLVRLNRKLPADVQIVSWDQVPTDFHPRLTSLGKVSGKVPANKVV